VVLLRYSPYFLSFSIHFVLDPIFVSSFALQSPSFRFSSLVRILPFTLVFSSPYFLLILYFFILTVHFLPLFFFIVGFILFFLFYTYAFFTLYFHTFL
jgi:hypothetical protein